MEMTVARVTFVVSSRADLIGLPAATSTESRTRGSPNFDKIKIVSQFAFHLIFVIHLVMQVLLQVLYVEKHL